MRFPLTDTMTERNQAISCYDQVCLWHRLRRYRLRRPLFGAAFVCLLAMNLSAQDKQPSPLKTNSKAEMLLEKGAFPEKWTHFSSEKNSKLSDTWTLDAATDPKVPVLKCTGKPSGYLRTKAEYDNFELTLEWMYPGDPNCNSGILIYCGADKIWPASIQVQLHRPLAGSIFPLKGAESTNRVTVKDLNLKIGVWHSCRIRSEKGKITLWIAGKQIGEVNGCKPARGYIALQSEGSEIHFRKISIVDLNPPKKTPPKKSVTKETGPSRPKS